MEGAAPDAAYAQSIPDSQPWFGHKGGKLPAMMGVPADDKPGPNYHNALCAARSLTAVAGLCARRHRRRKAGAGRCARHPEREPVGHDYEPRPQRRIAPVARPLRCSWTGCSRASSATWTPLWARDNYIVVLTVDHGFSARAEVQPGWGRAAGRQSGQPDAGSREDAGLEKAIPTRPSSRCTSRRRRWCWTKAHRAARPVADAVADAARGLLLAARIAAAYTRSETIRAAAWPTRTSRR